MYFYAPIAEIIASPVKLKVAGFLLTHEAPMSEREIASVLKMSHMSVNRAMAELSGINFVAYKTVGKAHMWMVNRKSYAYCVVKKIIETINAQALPLAVLKDAVVRHLSKEGVLKVVLFGSVAKGRERVDSDIDLFILVKEEKDKEGLELAIDKLSTNCINMFGNRLAPYMLSEKELKIRKSLAIVRAIEKGVVIYEPKV